MGLRFRAALRLTLGTLVAFATSGVCATGCGSRTGLEVPDASLGTVADVGPVGCVTGTIALERARPAVMFVLDRSGSMGDRLDATVEDTRWRILTRALGATLPAVDGTMQIGALFFPAVGSGVRGGAITCDVSSGADLTPAFGRVPSLLARMNGTMPGGGTPTSTAIDRAGSLLSASRAASNARALVLATDGAPDCNAALDAATCRCASVDRGCGGRPTLCLDGDRAVTTISAWESKGIPTYVVGLDVGGSGTYPDVLDAMAVAGGRPNKSGLHRFYGAASEAELDGAMTSIRDQVGACSYLTTSVPDDDGTITVMIDGVAVPYDESGLEGWSWASKSNGQIALAGTACTRAATADATKIEAIVECRETGG